MALTFGQDLVLKRSRESTSKVRTGCSTCKARRVKCDEATPICRRCAVGNRECEYKTTRVLPTRNVVTVYLPPTQKQPVFFVNDRGLDFFNQNLAGTLDGQFDSDFWRKLVLQLSHSEPSIRHAVSAISVIYQDVESSSCHPEGYVYANPVAEQEWNKAMKSLSARIQAHPNSNLVPLVCCLLFTCIEFLRGNIESSMLHVRSGFNILVALRCDNDAGPTPGSHFSFNDLKSIEDHIVPMFSRLNILCSLAGRVTPPMYAPPGEEDSPHENLSDSRRRLVEVSDTCLRFIGEASPKAAVFEIDVEILIEQVSLQARLDAWFTKLGKLLERMQAASNQAKQEVISLLMVHYKVIYIWLRVCCTAGEMATDNYHHHFEELVQHAEQVAKPFAGKAIRQPLSFEMHIMGPLFYTALKCRHPTIRKRALEMLQLAPRREGLWNAHYAYVTAKRIIELEEMHLNGQDLPDETSRVHDLPLPNDESRSYRLMPLDCPNIHHNIVPSPTCPGTLEAEFRTKPWGLWGEWQTITEHLKL